MTNEQFRSQVETLAEAVKATGPALDKEQTMLTLSALVAWCAMHQEWNSTGIAQFLRVTHESAIQAMISRDLATKGRIDCDCGECDADATRKPN